MNKEDTHQELIRYWWSMAEESLASAQRELEANALNFAVNRLYYAVFYSVRATLLERGFTFKKHTGVRAAFHREFIRTGQLKIEFGKLYDQLFEDRQEGDYVPYISFEKEYVEQQLTQCSEFLKSIRTRIKSIP